MARVVLITVSALLVSVLAGCYRVDSGASQIMPPKVKAVPVSAADIKGNETDIIEQMAVNRYAYRQGLETLITYYNNSGNNMKLGWARSELKALDAMPQFNYIIEAAVAGPELKASSSISEADYMYDDALRTEKRAKALVVVIDDNLLRVALHKYCQLIGKFPTSNKIGDAAFHIGGICEHFNDQTIAVLYYQRTWQWDPANKNPAKFKAAFILDQHLARRNEALELYQQAVQQPNLDSVDRQFAEQRIMDLTQSDLKLGK